MTTDLSQAQLRHIRSAFIFRMGYVAVIWVICVMLLNLTALAGGVITVLTFALPVIIALVAPMDWRWLNKHPDSVNRFGLRIGGRE